MREKLYEGIYLKLANDIRTGFLKAGTRLPSIRRQAEENGVSRNTVIGAYSLLIAEGYIISKEKSGYFAAEFETPSTQSAKPAGMEEKTRIRAKQEEENNLTENRLTDLSSNLVDSSLFPYSTLRQLYRETLSGSNISILETNGPFMGELSLRSSIAGYVHSHKGIICDANQIVIGSGTSYLLQILPSLFSERPVFLMEDPGFSTTREIVKEALCTIAGIPVDEEGASIDAIRRAGEKFSKNNLLLHISPSHQFPLGTTMTAPRRASIIKWANRDAKRYIIEDDYDSDFRYNGHPIPSIKSMDTEGRVIYIGTFSRTLSPSLRISYMILPPSLLENYEKRYSKFPCPVSRLDQKVISMFMDGGYFERHISRMRRIYKGRRNALTAEIRKYIPDTEIKGSEAGLHFIAKFPIPENAFIACAEKAGFRLRGTGTGWIILGYAHLSEDDIKRFGAFLQTLQGHFPVLYNIDVR